MYLGFLILLPVCDVIGLLSGVDIHSEDCQRFFRDGLTISFTKILNDDAVSGWKFEIHVSTSFSLVKFILMPIESIVISSTLVKFILMYE